MAPCLCQINAFWPCMLCHKCESNVYIRQYLWTQLYAYAWVLSLATTSSVSYSCVQVSAANFYSSYLSIIFHPRWKILPQLEAVDVNFVLPQLNSIQREFEHATQSVTKFSETWGTVQGAVIGLPLCQHLHVHRLEQCICPTNIGYYQSYELDTLWTRKRLLDIGIALPSTMGRKDAINLYKTNGQQQRT